MSKTIIITEKPSVAQEYRKVLKIQSNERKDGYIEGYSPILKKDVQITWAVGHLIALGTPEQHNAKWSSKHWSKENLPMIPEKYVYFPQKATYSQFQIVKKLYQGKDIERIYYAGDSGREGIYIQALIRNQIFGEKKPSFDERVVWIDSYTDESILNGIKTAKPYPAYQNMIDSGYARAITDWLIGMNLTQAFTLTSGRTHVGRVMTPTLALVVARQMEIDNFKPTDYFGINANAPWNPKWKADKTSRYAESSLLYNENGFKNEQEAVKLLSELEENPALTVKEVSSIEKKEYAPLLFNLAELQNFCSKTFHISPDQTLAIAQELYEKKMTTYPRTDARVLSSAVASDLEKKGYHVPSKYVDDSKITDHYAIIPTFHNETISGLTEQVYQAIYIRFMAIFEDPFVYDAIRVVYEHRSGEHFYANGRNIKQIGYKKLYGMEMEKPLTIPQKGTVIDLVDYELNPMTTQAPPYYTTGSLIITMEQAGKFIEDEDLRAQIKGSGIGTSATRAAIIKKLADLEYIKIDKKQKVTATEVGKSIISIIKKFDTQLISPEKTADMEQKLSDIATGKLEKTSYLFDVNQYIRSSVSNILEHNSDHVTGIPTNIKQPSASYECPFCKKPLKYGRFGWYCESKDFNFGLEIWGHKMKESDLKDLLTKGSTKSYQFTWKSGKKSNAKIVLDMENKKTTFSFD